MKKIQFCFKPDNIRSAALYLRKIDAKPVIGKSLDEIEEILKKEVMACFKKEYTHKVKNSSFIDDGMLHSVPWKGLGCVFTGCSDVSSPYQCIDSDMDVSELPIQSECVDVSFYIYADKNA